MKHNPCTQLDIIQPLETIHSVNLAIGLRLERFFETIFRSWGTFVAKNPWPVIIGSLFVSGYLAAGVFTRWQVTTDPVDLWVPAGSQARSDMEYFNQHFWKFYRIEQIIIEPKDISFFNASVDGEFLTFGPVFNQTFLVEAFDLQQKVLNISVEVDGKSVTINDICFKPLGGDCATQSVFTYYLDSKEELLKDNYLSKASDCTRYKSFVNKFDLIYSVIKVLFLTFINEHYF
jgi:Niemann-Pick C1 protein